MNEQCPLIAANVDMLYKGITCVDEASLDTEMHCRREKGAAGRPHVKTRLATDEARQEPRCVVGRRGALCLVAFLCLGGTPEAGGNIVRLHAYSAFVHVILGGGDGAPPFVGEKTNHYVGILRRFMLLLWSVF